MTSANHDGNHTPTLITVLNTNGTAIVKIKADASTHALAVSDGTTGSDHGPSTSLHDGNHTPILMATSSVDGKTPVAVYGDSSGNLLINSM